MATTTQRKVRAKESDTTNIQPTNSNLIAKTSSSDSYGLNLPQWDVNEALPGDLYTDSSSLPLTDKATADATVESIEQKRNTVRVVKANIDLSSDLVQAATAYRKLEGLAIDYATVGVDNQTKQVRYEIAGVRLETEQQKLLGEREQFNQTQIRTQGLTELTDITRDEWEQRKLLAQSKVNSLKLAVQHADNTYQQSLRNLLGSGSEDQA